MRMPQRTSPVDLVADHMVASMLAGLSGRRYERALEPVGDVVQDSASGTSQSSVSRRFIGGLDVRTLANAVLRDHLTLRIPAWTDTYGEPVSP